LRLWEPSVLWEYSSELNWSDVYLMVRVWMQRMPSWTWYPMWFVRRWTSTARCWWVLTLPVKSPWNTTVKPPSVSHGAAVLSLSYQPYCVALASTLLLLPFSFVLRNYKSADCNGCSEFLPAWRYASTGISDGSLCRKSVFYRKGSTDCSDFWHTGLT